MTQMHMTNSWTIFQMSIGLIAVLGVFVYLVAVIKSNRFQRKWPLYRTVFWIVGIFCAAAALVGPLGNRAHMDFTAHMLGHLLLGMLAPLLLVLAAPVTLFLRTLNVTLARRLSRILRGGLVRFLTNPITASVVNVGGLWVLYTTGVYAAMHEIVLLHMLIHIHVFLAGYLFTSSMIYIDPTPHRVGFSYRAVVLVFALAGHGILSKYIYAHPPIGVPVAQAETGAMLMYYGGDVIDLFLIFILCLHWFRATRPRAMFAMS